MISSLRGRLFIGFAAIIIFTGAIGGSLAYKWAYSEAIEVQNSVLVRVGSVRAQRVGQAKPTGQWDQP